MLNIENIKSVYFVGAGGIGMSALIRYFLSKTNSLPATTVHRAN